MAYKRLNGSSNIQQSDILVYQSSRIFFVVKYCVAIAGNILFNNKEVYTNGKKCNTSKGVKNLYRIQITNRQNFPQKLDSFEITSTLYPGNISSKYLKRAFSYTNYR